MSLIKISENLNLISTNTFPYATFPFDKFNQVQSGLMEVYDQDSNFVIAANTSAGKTVVAEIIASHEIRKNGNKVIYLSPLKSLSQEKLDDWKNPKHHFSNLNISICTGDYRLTSTRIKELGKSDIVIITSELLNSVARNAKSAKNGFLQDVGLVVCDEAHGISSLNRGPHLENGIMKFTQINSHARLLLLSATMPNVDQIGQWISTLNK